MEFKINHVSDIEKFEEMVDSFHGDAKLVTDNGDQMNLKSKLSQFAAFAKLFKAETIDNMKLRLSDPGDCYRMIRYLECGA